MKYEKFKSGIKAISPLEVDYNKNKVDGLLFKFLIVNSKKTTVIIELKSTEQSFRKHIIYTFRKASHK